MRSPNPLKYSSADTTPRSASSSNPERQMAAWITSGLCPLHEASSASRRSIL